MLRVLSAFATVLLLVGCSRAGFVPHPDARAEDARELRDSRSDTADAGADLADLLALDAAPPCAATADAETLLLFAVSASSGEKVIDATGQHHGAITGAVQRSPGPLGCGAALAFPGSSAAYVTVASDTAWQLAEGSVDLWVRIDALHDTQRGIVSRDAVNTEAPGHFTLFQLRDGGLAVRLQTLSVSVAQCSAPLTLGAWHHVGMNFGAGGLELFIDGVRAQRSGDTATKPVTLHCGTSLEAGIAGNDNPWVIGASSHVSDDGKATPIRYPFEGAIDSLRVSWRRRDFAAKSP